ncbi:MAG: uracil phosphoribosyltransferase [Pontiellaceae bacterium]|nr:uracil phosphoribosyltransferase [Pontiellaceae bacterium]MBN2786021.1 uracil phosphoribosyltransferase [Pontiellaceae bacterium]
MGRVVELKHPLVQHHLATLRDKATAPDLFRHQTRRLSLLLGCEATTSLPLTPCKVETPLESVECGQVTERIGLVPILRAGLGMCDALLELIPEAEVWHLGFYRDEHSLQPVEYYQKFSTSPPSMVFILDPMLATGGSAAESISIVKKWGANQIALLSLISAPEGIEKLTAIHPDVDIFTCAIDSHLNERAYIVPGLGDAGDRIFNTL